MSKTMTDKRLLKNLRYLFHPEAVAVIGASENPSKLGFHVMKSLTQGAFPGAILPINPGADAIMGISAYPSVNAVPEPIDLGVIVLPAESVPTVFDECIRKGIKAIVLITAGFKEIEDPRGAELQEILAGLANEAGIPVIGPNTFGMANLHRDLNASFTPEFSRLPKGTVALVSQSGGISHLMAFMAMRQDVGISKIVGLGNRLNVDFSDMVVYLMNDSDTNVIMLYLEGLDDPRRLIEAVSAKRGVKPVLAYKTGRAESGDRASLSHTGSMAGRHEVYDGALKQAGVLCFDDTQDLLDAARALAMCPPPGRGRIGVLSGQAGPAMAACDACEAEGLEIAVFGPETQIVVNGLLPPLALRTNPVDMGPAWYSTTAITGVVKAVLEDDGVDGILLLMMFASANRAAVAGIKEFLLEWKQKKPVVGCLIAPPGIWDSEVADLEKGGALINLPTPERAAKIMAALWRYKKMLAGLKNE